MQLSSELLADYALEVSIDDMSDDVVEQAERLTLDTLGCTIGAFASPPSKILRTTYDNRDGGDSHATVLGTSKTVDTEYAALINGTMGRYFDFNDCYSTKESACHPSDHIPPLLSIAEAEGASGAELIEAIVLAFEIQSRGVDTGAIWKHGFDYTTWGAYSSAASVGKLMGLEYDELVNAIGMAGTANNGMLISRLGEVSMWKGVAMPFTIHNAVQACQLAKNGLTGPEHVFEGHEGFFDTVARDTVEFEGLGGRDGAGFRIMETSIKAFACGYYTHPSVTAVLDIVREHDLEPDEIESIDVRTFSQAVQVYASGPEKWDTDLTRETADHSLPYNVSVAILNDEVTPEQYEEEYLTDSRVHEMMQKVSVEADDDLDQYRLKNPRHVPATARITAGGETYESRANYPMGHPERPMTNEQIEEKATGLVDEYLTDDQVTQFIDNCYDLSSADSVDDLVSTLVI